jgi:hypothetical protein
MVNGVEPSINARRRSESPDGTDALHEAPAIRVEGERRYFVSKLTA